MGSVTKRGTSHRAIVRMAGHPTLTKTFSTAREAAAWVRETETMLADRVITNPRIKIIDLIDKYVADIAPRRSMAKGHLTHEIPAIRRVFADMRMDDLTGKGLRDWVVMGKGNPKIKINYGHISRLTGVLRQVERYFDVPVPWKDIKTCKASLVEMGYIGPAKERNRRVSDEELALIKQHIKPRVKINFPDIFDFALATAMRISEVCRIRWEDMNDINRTVIIRDRKHPSKRIGNHQAVPLLCGAYEIAQRQPRVAECVFPQRSDYISDEFHGCVVRSGLKDIVMHDLRHEGISRLFELGFQIQEVALVSGHGDWKTLKRYTHLRPESLVEKERKLRLLAA